MPRGMLDAAIVAFFVIGTVAVVVLATLVVMGS